MNGDVEVDKWVNEGVNKGVGIDEWVDKKVNVNRDEDENMMVEELCRRWKPMGGIAQALIAANSKQMKWGVRRCV